MTSTLPRRNRVTPFGLFEAVPERGAMMGNRGDLYRTDGSLSSRTHVGRAWICCRLSFKGRQVAFDSKGHYTPLFFLDEATAFAAGHRPCAECRREDYRRFRALFGETQGMETPRAAEMDRVLHAARLTPDRRQRRYPAPSGTLPVGTMVAKGDTAFLVAADGLRRWSPAGYGPAEPHPDESVDVLTPEPVVRIFSAGYRPGLTLFEKSLNQS